MSEKLKKCPICSATADSDGPRKSAKCADDTCPAGRQWVCWEMWQSLRRVSSDVQDVAREMKGSAALTRSGTPAPAETFEDWADRLSAAAVGEACHHCDRCENLERTCMIDPNVDGPCVDYQRAERIGAVHAAAAVGEPSTIQCATCHSDLVWAVNATRDRYIVTACEQCTAVGETPPEITITMGEGGHDLPRAYARADLVPDDPDISVFGGVPVIGVAAVGERVCVITDSATNPEIDIMLKAGAPYPDGEVRLTVYLASDQAWTDEKAYLEACAVASMTPDPTGRKAPVHGVSKTIIDARCALDAANLRAETAEQAIMNRETIAKDLAARAEKAERERDELRSHPHRRHLQQRAEHAERDLRDMTNAKNFFRDESADYQIQRDREHAGKLEALDQVVTLRERVKELEESVSHAAALLEANESGIEPWSEYLLSRKWLGVCAAPPPDAPQETRDERLARHGFDAARPKEGCADALGFPRRDAPKETRDELPHCPKCGESFHVKANDCTRENYCCGCSGVCLYSREEWLRYVAENTPCRECREMPRWSDPGEDWLECPNDDCSNYNIFCDPWVWIARSTPCRECGDLPGWSNGFIYHSCLYPRPDGWLHTCTPAEWIARNKKGEEDEVDKGGKGDICDGHRKMGNSPTVADGLGGNRGVGCQGGADASGQGSGTGRSRRRDSRRVDHDGPSDAHDRSSRGRDSILCETAPTPGTSVEVAPHDKRRDALERAKKWVNDAGSVALHTGPGSSTHRAAIRALIEVVESLVNAALDGKEGKK